MKRHQLSYYTDESWKYYAKQDGDDVLVEKREELIEVGINVLVEKREELIEVGINFIIVS